MSEKRPYLASTKEEALAYRKMNSVVSDLKGNVTDEELLWDGDESKLVARRGMADKIYGIQESGRLVKSEGEHYAMDMHDDLNRDTLFLDTLTRIKLHSDKTKDKAAKNKAAKDALVVAEKANNDKNKSGKVGSKVVTPGTAVINEQKEAEKESLKPEVLGSRTDQFMNFFDSLETNDQWRMGLLFTDVISTIAGYVPVAHIGSAAVGAATTVGYAGIDYADENVHWWDATKGLVLGLGLDALSLVGGKGLKAAKSVSKLAPFFAKAVPAMRTSLLAYATYGGITAQQKTDWKAIFDDKDISKWTMEDYANAAAAAQFLLGGTKAIGRGAINRVAKGNATNFSKTTGLERNFVGKGKAKVVQKAKDARGVYTKYERPAAYVGQKVAAGIAGKPSIIDVVQGHKNMRTTRTTANKAGDVLQKKTHNTDISRGATNRTRERTSTAITNARNARVKVDIPDRTRAPMAGAVNKPLRNNVNLQPVKLKPRSSKIKVKPYQGQKADYGDDLFSQKPAVAPIKTGTVKVKQPTVGVDTNQPTPKPSSKVKGDPDEFKNKSIEKVTATNTLQRRSNKKYQEAKGKEKEAKTDKTNADVTATKSKATLEKMTAALEPKARGTINKMQKDLDATVKKKTAQIDTFKKQKTIEEKKLKKATTDKEKKEIQKTIDKHDSTIKAQQKALDNVKLSRQSKINKEINNKWKNLYRAPRGWVSNSAVPWVNTQITRVANRLPISGTDIRHMKNVDRAEDFRERDEKKLAKRKLTDAEKYLNKSSRYIKNQKKKNKNKKTEKKAMGGKLVRKFQGGAKIPDILRDIARDIRYAGGPSGIGGSFTEMMEKYNSLNVAQKKLVEQVYKEDYGITLGDDIKANHTPEEFETFERNKAWGISKAEYNDLSEEEKAQKHADFIEGQGNVDLQRPEGIVDPLTEIDNEIAKEKYEDTDGYKQWLAQELKKDVDFNGEPILTREELNIMQADDEELDSFDEEKLDPRTFKGYEPSKYNWKDAASILPAVFNPGDILNLINTYKEPNQYTAHYTPTKGSTFSQRVVENAPGYEQMKNRLSQDSFNVKSSDLMTKSTLQKRNLDIKNKSLGELQAQNANYIEGIKQQNREATDKTRASMIQADNINAQALNQRALMDAQGRAKQDTLLTKRKMNLIGTIGGRLSYGLQMGLNNKNASDVANLKGQYGHFSDFAAEEYANFAPEDERTDLEKESLIREKYNKLYGIDPGSDEFGADYNKQLENYRRTNYLVKRNGYYS